MKQKPTTKTKTKTTKTTGKATSSKTSYSKGGPLMRPSTKPPM